jgi:hypothetical protein
MKYTFDKDRIQLFSALVILDSIIDKDKHFVRNLLSLDEEQLSPVFDRMIEKGLLFVDDSHEYVPTDKGYELIDNFYQRFQEFLKFYDLYCAVDLEAGEFAFEKILDMSEEEFQDFLNDERWEDVRVAVCEFKKIDPLQMIFLSFLKENRIDVNVNGWPQILTNGSLWDEITEICESAITVEQLSVDEQLKNIVSQGSELLKTLLEREQQEQESVQEQEITETVTTTTEEIIEEDVVDDITYYDPYFYDPYYVSPCWGYYYVTPYWW